MLVLLLSGGAAAVLLVGNPFGSDDHASNSGPGAKGVTAKQAVTPTGIDNGHSVLGAPTSNWTVQASDLLPGGTFDPLHSWEGSNGAETLTFPHATVVHLTGDSDNYLLAALDPTNGKVLWTKKLSQDGNSCFSVIEHTRLLCTTTTGDGNGAGTYELLDPTTGQTLGTYQGVVGDEGVDSDRKAIYLGTNAATSARDHSVNLTKLSAGDLHKQWSVTGKDPGPDKDQGDEFDGGVWVNDGAGHVNVSYGYLDWSFDTSTGDQTSFATGGNSGSGTKLENGFLVTDSYSDGGQQQTRVDDVNGNSILSVHGPAWSPADFTSPRVNNGRIGVAGALYDLSTGKELWNDADLAAVGADGSTPDLGMSWSPTGDQVLLNRDDLDTDTGDTTSSSTLVNATDGSVIWQLPRTTQNDPAVWTDDALVTVDGTDVMVRSRTGDQEAWKQSVADLAADQDLPTYGLGVSSTSVIVASDNAIRGFTGFPAAGRSSTAQADGQTGTQSGSESDGGTQYVTACGSTPQFTPVESQAAGGGITITFEVHAVCPGGEGSWLNASGQRVTLTGKDGTVYADATFDFSSNPYWIPGQNDDPVRLQLTFGYDTVFATTTELTDAISAHIILVACVKDPGSSEGTVPSDPSFGADPTQPAQASGPPTSASAAALSEEAALAALRRISRADAADVAGLDGQWVPQLSSKKKGTSDDGITYTIPDILAEHLRLRARYPEAKLVFSTDVGSFLVDGYWVTVVAAPSPGWRPALQWCPDNGFDKDHCYAKRIVRDGTPDGNTKHLADLTQ